MGIVMLVIIGLSAILMLILDPVNSVVGIWDCANFTGSPYDDLNDLNVTFELKKDKTFVWSKYGDVKSNYVKGTFKFEDLKKSSSDGLYSYYKIELIGKEYVVDGLVQSEKYSSEYEMAVGTILNSDSKDKALLYNDVSSRMFSCKKR